MTREEVITLIRKECESVAGSLMVDRRVCEDIVNRVFKDFESRTCKNCKYYIDGICEESFMVYTQYFCGDFMPPEDFGCNRLERKKDE